MIGKSIKIVGYMCMNKYGTQVFFTKKNWVTLVFSNGFGIEGVWIGLKVAFSVLHFQAFFFFSPHVNSKITWFYCVGDKKYCSRTVHTLFMGPTTLFTHLKIILLQCFQFSVFSFSNNKFNPNRPIVSIKKTLIQQQ